jgi:broad specificity phosphatase PhoE
MLDAATIDLLIIAHAGVIRAISAHAFSAPLASMYRLSISSASILRLHLDSERPPTIPFQDRRKL